MGMAEKLLVGLHGFAGDHLLPEPVVPVVNRCWTDAVCREHLAVHRIFADATTACLVCADVVLESILAMDTRAPQRLFTGIAAGMNSETYQRAEGLVLQDMGGFFPEEGRSSSLRFLYLGVLFYLRNKGEPCTFDSLYYFLGQEFLKQGERGREVAKNFFEIP